MYAYVRTNVFVSTCTRYVNCAQIVSDFIIYLKIKNAFTVISHSLASLFPIGGKLLIGFVKHCLVVFFDEEGVCMLPWTYRFKKRAAQP